MNADDNRIEPAARGLSLTGQPLPVFTETVSAPLGTTPLRRANSVRRTMSIDAHWPEGVEGAGHYLGRSRDTSTRDPVTDPGVLAEAELHSVAVDRQIIAISATPAPPRLQQLVGMRAGSHLRHALADVMAEEKTSGAPLYLLMDDMAGATLVSRWAFSRWRDDWIEAIVADRPRPKMEGVCIGFRPGSSALSVEGQPLDDANASRVVPLPNPADPAGWHDLPHYEGVHFRRARWIDIWREGNEIVVEALFQDSSSAPDGGDRWAIHEYRLGARIDAAGRVLRLEATPGTLPYAACRVAYVNNAVLIGTPASELRETVLEMLKKTGGCTHLNDTLRALAEVPILADRLPDG